MRGILKFAHLEFLLEKTHSIKAKPTTGLTFLYRPNSWEATDDNLPDCCNLHDYCIIVNSINCFPISVDFD